MAKNPLERVSEELTQHCDISEPELTESMKRILMRYHDEALEEASRDITSDDATSKITDYRVLGELINQFGTALIAFDDMEEETGAEILTLESDEMN